MLPAATPPGLSGEVPLREGSPVSSPVSLERQDGDLIVSNQSTYRVLLVSDSDQFPALSQSALETTQRMSHPPAKKSWVNAARKHTFTQQKFVSEEVDGQATVVVPKEVFLGAKPLWEDFLIGHFLNAKAPHVGKIHMIVNKIWRLGDKSNLIDVYAVNDSTIKFRIRNEAMRRRALNRGMWNIMDLPMVVSKWSPFAEETQPAMKSIQLWITLTDVPPSLFTDKGLEFLASAVGKPIRLHPKTESCSSFDEAQLLVEADLTKELPKEFVFTGEEEGELAAVIKYSYPWLPPRCSCCDKWGHLRDSCLSALKTCSRDTPNPDPIHVEETETGQVLSNSQTAASVTAECVTENIPIIPISEDGKEEEKGAESWITPKFGRSPPKKQEGLQFGEVSILSNSYSALNGKDESGEDIITADSVEKQAEETQNSTQDPPQEKVENQNRLAKKEMILRHSLPRGSKSAHKVLSNPSTRNNPKDQSKGLPPKHH